MTSPAVIEAVLSEATDEALRRLGKGRYIAWGSARILQDNEVPELVISGPAGTGKSRACLEKIHRLASTWPRSRFLFARKTRASLTESALQTYEEWVLGPGHPIIEGGASRRFRQVYTYPTTGAEIIVGGLDKPSRIMSTEFDLIFVQEAIELEEDDWEVMTTRLRNNVVPFQQLLADTNPGPPRHWLKQRSDLGTSLLLESLHEDNPRLYDHDLEQYTEEGKKYIGTLDRLTGFRKDRLRWGKWVQAEGVIFEGYQPAIHLIDRFRIPSDWRRFRSIDFGFTNPFVCQWWAVDPDGRMYLYKEIYMTGRTVRDHAGKIHEVGKKIEQGIHTICDHDAEDRATLGEHGIRNQAADKRVSVGIDKVNERLRVAEDGKPRIFFLRDSVVEIDQDLVDRKLPFATSQEFEGYVWANKVVKEEPVKINDHGMDDVRYAVMYEDGGRKTGGIFV